MTFAAILASVDAFLLSCSVREHDADVIDGTYEGRHLVAGPHGLGQPQYKHNCPNRYIQNRHIPLLHRPGGHVTAQRDQQKHRCDNAGRILPEVE